VIHVLWEELIHERIQDFLVIIVVDLSSENTFRNKGSECIPWDFGRINWVSIVWNGIDPLVNAIESAALVCFVKGINLGPSDRCVSKAFLDYSIEPRNYKVKASSLVRNSFFSLVRQNLVVWLSKCSSDSTWRFKGKNMRSSQQRRWDFRAIFHGQK
jgi:hypothetical protein